MGSSTLIGGLINYFYHPLMLQYLSLETFGEFGSMLGIFNILGVLTTGISLFLVQEISRYSGNKQKLITLYRWTLPRIILLWVGLFVVFLLLSPVLMYFLHIQIFWPFVLVGSVIILSFSWVLFSAFIQGLQKFRFLSLLGIISAVAKFLVGLGLVMLGAKIYGAIGWLLAWGTVWLLVSLWYVYSTLLPHNTSYTPQDGAVLAQHFRQEFPSLLRFFLLVFVLSLFMNGDIILARNIFSPEDAGIYSAVSVIGKFVIFLWLAIETVYYPKITQIATATEVPRVWLKNASWLMVIMLILAVGGAAVLGWWVLKIMKPELMGYGYLLVLVVLMAGLYVFLSFYAKILVAWKDRSVVYWLAGGLVTLLGFVYLLGSNSLEYFVYSILVVESILTLILGIKMFMKNKDSLVV